MFYRPPSKSERKSFIQLIPPKHGFQDITNIAAVKTTYQPIQEKKKNNDQIDKIPHARATQLNNIIENCLPYKKKHQRYNRGNRQQAGRKENINIINRPRNSLQKRYQHHERSQPVSKRLNIQNSKILAGQIIFKQIYNENISLGKLNFDQKIEKQNINHNQVSQNVNAIVQESQNLFNVRKISVSGTKERYNDGYIQLKGKFQFRVVKQKQGSQRSLSFKERCQIAAQVYKNSQRRSNRINSQRKKSFGQNPYPSTTVLKNQIQNKPFPSSSQFPINSNKYAKGQSFKESRRQKPIDTSKSDNSKIIDNTILQTQTQRNFIIKPKSIKVQANNKNDAYLEAEDMQITEDKDLNFVNNNNKQINTLKEDTIQGRKRSATASSKNIQGSSKQIICCHLREKSDHMIHKKAQNFQSYQRLDSNGINGITINQYSLNEIICKTQEKQRQKIFKQIEATQSIKCIIEEIENNRQLKQSTFNTNRTNNPNAKPNFDKKSDNEPKSQISIVWEQHHESIEEIQIQPAKEEYMNKGFPKKIRRNYMRGCKTRRIDWGKSKQKDRLSDKILADIPMPINIQDFYTAPLDQNQIKKQIQSEFGKQAVKMNTINLFQQLVMNGDMMALSLIAHDQNDQTPLQSLQELYRQL